MTLRQVNGLIYQKKYIKKLKIKKLRADRCKLKA